MAVIKEFIENIFCPTPIKVGLPHAYRIYYNDIGPRVEAYMVAVKYKSGKIKEFTFPVDNDHLQLVSKEKAYQRAIDFYRKQRVKVKAYQKLHRNENTK